MYRNWQVYKRKWTSVEKHSGRRKQPEYVRQKVGQKEPNAKCKVESETGTGKETE